MPTGLWSTIVKPMICLLGESKVVDVKDRENGGTSTPGIVPPSNQPLIYTLYMVDVCWAYDMSHRESEVVVT